jgi:biopolymer transport protein ExbD
MRTDFGEDNELNVDMAPLIDCVFLLLIFFLVATTLKKIDKELPLKLPDAAASMEVQQPDKFAVVSIDRDGKFYLDGTPVPVNMLQSELRSKAATDPKFKVRLDADKDVPFIRVMEILDILRFEGLDNVGINTSRESSS